MSNPESTTRLQVYLAKRGVASRRACSEIILNGRITVNGERICEPGFRVTSDMRVSLDDQELPEMAEAIRSIIMYKPRGYICSRKLQSTSRNLGTIYDLLEDIPEKCSCFPSDSNIGWHCLPSNPEIEDRAFPQLRLD